MVYTTKYRFQTMMDFQFWMNQPLHLSVSVFCSIIKEFWFSLFHHTSPLVSDSLDNPDSISDLTVIRHTETSSMNKRDMKKKEVDNLLSFNTNPFNLYYYINFQCHPRVISGTEQEVEGRHRQQTKKTCEEITRHVRKLHKRSRDGE